MCSLVSDGCFINLLFMTNLTTTFITKKRAERAERAVIYHCDCDDCVVEDCKIVECFPGTVILTRLNVNSVSDACSVKINQHKM